MTLDRLERLRVHTFQICRMAGNQSKMVFRKHPVVFRGGSIPAAFVHVFVTSNDHRLTPRSRLGAVANLDLCELLLHVLELGRGDAREEIGRRISGRSEPQRDNGRAVLSQLSWSPSYPDYISGHTIPPATMAVHPFLSPRPLKAAMCNPQRWRGNTSACRHRCFPGRSSSLACRTPYPRAREGRPATHQASLTDLPPGCCERDRA